jgi:pyruvate-ferredoxin/flavodoxin oxidoreductase
VGANKNSDQDSCLGRRPACAGLLRLRLQEVRVVHDLAFALRAEADPRAVPLKSASFIGVHKFDFLFKLDTLGAAARGATVLINSPYPVDEVWNELPQDVQQQCIDRQLKLYVIDASQVAAGLGLGSRVNTILQTCFFALSGVMPRDAAIDAIKRETEKTYARKGKEVVKKNFAAIDSALENMHEVTIPKKADGKRKRLPLVPDNAPPFVRDVTATILALRGDSLPVSAIPVDGTFPDRARPASRSATSRPRSRSGSPTSAFSAGSARSSVPHSVIRAKYYDQSRLEGAPSCFQAAPINARGYPDSRFTLQVYLEDCTGCGVCVENCPAHSPEDAKVKAINMEDRIENLEAGRESIKFFETLPWADRTRVNFRQRARRAVPGAAVRVLGRVRRMRRDAVPEAAVAALRRSPAGSQRHRAVRRSMARTCPQHHGRPTPRAAARPGRTRCSKTTLSSAWGIAWPSTARPHWPGRWRNRSRRKSAPTWSPRSCTRRRSPSRTFACNASAWPH